MCRHFKPQFIKHSSITSFDAIFMDTIDDLDMKELISEPTRISGTAASLRDLALLSDDEISLGMDFYRPSPK